MANRTCWETFKAESATAVDQIKEMMREGTVRRVIVEHHGRTIAEFPLVVGVVGTMVSPVLAGVGALVAVVKDCTIRVERQDEPPPAGADTAASSEPAPRP